MSKSAHFFVVLDADSTLFTGEAIEEIAEEAEARDAVTQITEQAMRGEIDFSDSLRQRVAALSGVSTFGLERARLRLCLTPGAQELVDAVHEAGGAIGVVSGGFHEILDPVAAELGLDEVRANRLEFANGIMTGSVIGRIIDAKAKAETLQEWATEYRIAAPSRTIAVGDGANDLEMMAIAGLSVAFNAKPIVQQRADLVAGTVNLRQIIPLFSPQLFGKGQ